MKYLEKFTVLSASTMKCMMVLSLVLVPGYAKADPLSWQGGNVFESSTYASANLMWQVLPYLTVGAEYAYGLRENKDGSDIDNHRVAFGFQFY